MTELDGNDHSVFKLCYHIILVIKYRRSVIDSSIQTKALEVIRQYIESQGEKL